MIFNIKQLLHPKNIFIKKNFRNKVLELDYRTSYYRIACILYVHIYLITEPLGGYV